MNELFKVLGTKVLPQAKAKQESQYGASHMI